MRLVGHGRSVDAPRGWDVRIFRRQGAAPVLHLATFPLNEQDGDFGAGPTGRMRPDDIFVALVEYLVDAQVRPGQGLFSASGCPRSLRASEFGPQQLQVTRRGQLGVQRFFTTQRRACCLYAVLRPVHKRPEELVRELNAVLRTIQFDTENSRDTGGLPIALPP
jgi:hypothetical protein